MELWGGGGVKQTTLYTEQSSDYITTSGPSGAKNITLSDSISNYDYIYIAMVGIASTVIRPEANSLIKSADCDGNNYFYLNYGSDTTYHIEGYITPSATTTIRVEGYWGTGYTGVKIISVTGIKYIDPDIKNATSLDETLLYSGNDQITATTGSTAYTLSDDIINFDYILVTIYGINSGTTQSVNVLAKVPVSDSYGFDFNTQGHLSYINSYGGWFVLSNNQIEFALRYKGENVSSVVLSSVVGIKLNTLSTADIAEMAMPSDVSVNIPIGTSGDTYNSYTITANGYVNFGGSFANGVPILRVDHSNGSSFWVCLSSNNWDAVFIPVKKGDIVKWRYSSGSSSVSLTFFYSIGDAKALGLI